MFGVALLWWQHDQRGKEAQKAQKALWRAARFFQAQRHELALKGDPERKIPGLLEVAQTWPKTKAGQQAHLYLGKYHMQQGHYRRAVDHFKRCRFQDGLLQPAIYAWIADGYLALDNPKEAIRFYEKAIAQAPNPVFTPDYYAKLACLYEKQGRRDQALATYQRLAKAFPNAPLVYDQAQKAMGRLTFLLVSEA